MIRDDGRYVWSVDPVGPVVRRDLQERDRHRVIAIDEDPSRFV